VLAMASDQGLGWVLVEVLEPAFQPHVEVGSKRLGLEVGSKAV